MIYRLMCGVAVRRSGQAPAYAGYLASAFVLPGGSKNDRVIAPGSEELVGSTGQRHSFVGLIVRGNRVHYTR